MRKELAELIREGRAQLIGPIRQELLSGIRDESQFERLRERLRAFDDEPLVSEDYEEAALISNGCRTAGIAGSAVDFLVCAVALRRGWQVFTTDEGFPKYARNAPITLYKPRTGT